MNVKVRPVRADDCQEIFELALTAQAGLTTLPKDINLIEKKVQKSVQSFQSNITHPGDEYYMFAMEDLDTERTVGVSAIIASVGQEYPFFAYDLQGDVLIPLAIHDGPTECATLYVHPNYREKGGGRVISLSRFLYIAAHRSRFKETMIAELRGISSKGGKSPFWDDVGRSLYKMSFLEADLLSSYDKKFIKENFNENTISLKSLSKKAQEVIAKPHKNSEAALYLLLKEGFTLSSQIDIFDAGPKVSSMVNQCRIVRESKIGVVSKFSDAIQSELCLIYGECNEHIEIHCSQATINSDHEIFLPKKFQYSDLFKKGSLVRIVPLKSTTFQERFNACLKESTSLRING